MRESNLFRARTWIAKHAREIMVKVRNYPADKPIMLKMGYGPSGSPHIGTITELIRTCMVAKTLRLMQSRPVIVISFADDLDGMRKVPPNLPNFEMMEPYLGCPLSRVPDPFMEESSFAEYNLKRLKNLIKEFGYVWHDYRPTKENPFSIEELLRFSNNSEQENVIILRASDMYSSGSYNKNLTEILHNYQKVLDIVLPTLGEEREKTYSPFMPISSKTGKVLETGVLEYYPEENSILVSENHVKEKIKVENDNCKLQWKVDFAMQWMCFGIDYEMSGKDIAIGTYPISRAILEALGYTPPITPMYEMFLAEDGSRISKTKGNGLSLDDFLKYTTTEVIRHFMFLSPSSAKRLDIQKIPSYVNAFVKDLEDFNHKNQLEEDAIENIVEENAIWYSERDPPENPHFNASTILNLIEGKHPPKVEDMIDFLTNTRNIKLNSLDFKIVKAMYYFYHDHYIKPHFHDIPNNCIKYMEEFMKYLSDDGEEMQTKIRELGKLAIEERNIPDMKSWFQMIYLAIIGEKEGPRLGGLFALYGPEESGKLINKAIAK